MKRLFCLFFTLTLLFSLSACGEPAQDTSPVSMLVASGNGETYYTALADLIKKDLGIEVEFVFQQSNNTSEMQRLYFANDDLPADIIFTASKTDDSILKDCCVDLLSNSSVAALYTSSTIQNCTTADGAIYQLPVSSKLIGITYNETLMNEMGWDVPKNFDDMVGLKAKCDEAGIKFAVSDGIATGHGFNWLFHLMGADWLSTPEGTQWLESFQAGSCSVDEFKKECEYFRKWTEAGLWGNVRTQDWNGWKEFSTTRSLFWFGLTNSMTGYQGPQLDDAGNETGVTLNDTYKSMPWISEDGLNNCFTYYDNCWIYLNKELEAPEKSEKLQKALKILEYMATGAATGIVTEISKDTYVSVNNYEMGDDRIYSAYNESIKNGFIQPWYYNSFDADSVNLAGAAVNAYITGNGSFDDIFKVLEDCNQLELNAQIDVLADFPEGLDYEGTAKLAALAAATALDRTLEENGRNERVQVTLAPYTPGANLLPPWRAASVCNSIVYKGELDSAAGNTIFAPGTNIPTGVYMTGAEIREITENKFDPSDRYINSETGECTFDAEHYGPYPYVCLVKDGAELVDDQEYLVAICEKYITLAQFTKFSESGRVITDLEDTHTLVQGLAEYAAAHPQITSKDLVL